MSMLTLVASCDNKPVVMAQSRYDVEGKNMGLHILPYAIYKPEDREHVDRHIVPWTAVLVIYCPEKLSGYSFGAMLYNKKPYFIDATIYPDGPEGSDLDFIYQEGNIKTNVMNVRHYVFNKPSAVFMNLDKEYTFMPDQNMHIEFAQKIIDGELRSVTDDEVSKKLDQCNSPEEITDLVKKILYSEREGSTHKFHK